MRITFLSHFPGRGGSTSLLLQIQDFFKARGHETSVVVGRDSPDPQIKSYQVFQPPPGADWRRRLAEYRELVESTRPDVAYFISGVEEGDVLRFLRCARVRHTSALEQHAVLDAPFWVRYLIPYWEAVSANTPDVFGLLRRIASYDYEELYAPYRLGQAFYDLRPPFHPLKNRPIEICCIGRLENYQKRMNWVPRIIEGCRRAGRDFTWHIYGTGPVEEAFRSDVQRRGCADIVQMHGWVAEADVAQRASQHDIYFSCSRFEGMPIALQQAMFCGLYCVAPDLPAGIHYVIEKGAVAGYRADSPQSGVRALLANTADRGLLAENRVRTWELAFKLFGPAVVEREFLRSEAILQTLSFNGRIHDLDRAPKVRVIPLWRYALYSLFGDPSLKADEKF